MNFYKGKDLHYIVQPFRAGDRCKARVSHTPELVKKQRERIVAETCFYFKTVDYGSNISKADCPVARSFGEWRIVLYCRLPRQNSRPAFSAFDAEG